MMKSQARSWMPHAETSPHSFNTDLMAAEFPHFLRLAMSIENGILSFPHFLRRPAMCNETTYRTYGAETSS